MEILAKIPPNSFTLSSNWLRDLHLLQPLPAWTPREGQLESRATKPGWKWVVGFLRAGRDFVHVSNLVIVVVSFLCLLNQGAAQLAAKGEAHVITKVWERLEMGASPSFYPSGALLFSKADKKTSKQTKKSNNYDSLRYAKFWVLEKIHHPLHKNIAHLKKINNTRLAIRIDLI